MNHCPLDCSKCTDDKMICSCLQITETDLCNALATLDLKSVRDIRIHTGAGEGCTSCHTALHLHLEAHRYAAASSPICSVK